MLLAVMTAFSLRRPVSLFLLGSLFAASSLAATTPQLSPLWGSRGESWKENGRLPDFSHAGYHRGDVPLPNVPQTANVKDFGAVGDGVADDTKAINAAIAATARGAIFFPVGRYKITDYIRIEKSNIVLRGAGPDRSVLWFPRGLDEIHPRQGRTSTGSPASGYSFDGAFVQIRGDYQAKPLAQITAPSRRGDRTVEVDTAAALSLGQQVLVTLKEAPDHSLKMHLYNDDPGDIRKGKMLDTRMLVSVVKIEGPRVTFDRPLRFDTRAAWSPQLRSFRPTVTECGIEGLGFAFPGTQYRGHFKENGANAIELRQVSHCWVRNVSIHNGDLGINLVACRNTVDGVLFTADAARGFRDGGVSDCTGHHAIQIKNGEDNLVTRFDFRTSYIHDLTVEHASGNVFAAGRGVDLNFDHHKDTPYENLFTDIDCGRGTRVWRCGGGASLGRQSAGWETFWNIRAAQKIAPPPPGWGPATMNFIGLSPEQFEPRNLYVAQRERAQISL